MTGRPRIHHIVLMLVIAGMLAGVAGCLGPANPGYREGFVSIGPICPVEQVNVTCPVPPSAYEARKIVVSTEEAQVVTLVDINSDGFYRVALAPDTYIVDINHVGIDRSADVPTTITILTGQTTVLNISIDTGIR